MKIEEVQYQIIDDIQKRNELVSRTEILDKVKAVPLFPNEMFVGVSHAANYYETSYSAIRKAIARHKEEFQADGVKLISGNELENYQSICFANNYRNDDGSLYIGGRARMFTVIPKRALLRLGMILKESKIAIEIRNYLLNLESNCSVEQKLTVLNDNTKVINLIEGESLSVPKYAAALCRYSLGKVYDEEQISNLIKQCELFGIDRNDACLLLQESIVNDLNPQDEILKFIKEKKEIISKIKRGRINERVTYIGMRYFEGCQKVYGILSDKLRFDLGINMSKIRKSFADKSKAPGYLDLIEKYDAFDIAEEKLDEILKECESKN